MMKFKVEIDVMPHEALLDPQGKAVTGALKNLGFTGIDKVRIGKHITLLIEASSKSEAIEMVDKACSSLLCNHIMERYQFSLTEC